MAEYTRDEALAFISAIRLAIEGKVGFRWLVAKLGDLASYVEALSTENEQLKAYIDSTGARDDYESYRSEHR